MITKIKIPASASVDYKRPPTKANAVLMFEQPGYKAWGRRLRPEVEEWLDARTRWYYCGERSVRPPINEPREKRDPIATLVIYDSTVALLFKLTYGGV
jgi:hypothetical protein